MFICVTEVKMLRGTMVENKQHVDEQAVQELRNNIEDRGWKDSAEFIIGDIEFVADLCHAGHLSRVEIRDFSRAMQITIDNLLRLRDRPYEEEVRRLEEAVHSFNRAGAPCWHDLKEHLDQARQVFVICCESWRSHVGVS
jgi:hypothetical protein